MSILFIIYFPINLDIVVVNYTDDGSLELESETSELVLYHGNVLIIIWKCLKCKGQQWNHDSFSRRLYYAIVFFCGELYTQTWDIIFFET